MDSRVYIVVTKFFPRPGDWRGAYCFDFVRALRKQLKVKSEEWKVEVFVEGSGEDYEVGGIRVHVFKTRYLPSNVFPFLFKRYNQRSFLEKVQNVIGDVDTVEVCHCHTANFGIYAEAIKEVNPKCKTLLHHHDLASFGLNMGALRHCWLYNLVQFPILRRMHERIDCHVFISEASRRSFLAAPDASWTVYDDYKRQMRGLPWRAARIKDSIILHNGVDVGKFKVQGSKFKVRVEGDGRFVIGCVANFEVLKDQMTLLRAVAQLRVAGCGLRVVFVGSGPELEKCRRFAAEKKLDVGFRTEMWHEDLPAFYRELDLFVLPSYFEGFGCVFTEAHACGVPFITCEGQGMDDLIAEDDREKWLCKVRDPENLAKKIKGYVENRWEQKLTEDQDIDKLVGKFVESLRAK